MEATITPRMSDSSADVYHRYTKDVRCVRYDMHKYKPYSEDDEDKYFDICFKMLIHAAVLEYMWADIETELKQAGLFKQSIKYDYNKRIGDKIHKFYDGLWERMNGQGAVYGRWYNDAMEEAYKCIQEHVYLQAPVRAVNIALSLIRLIDAGNVNLDGYHWDLPNVHFAYKILQSWGIEDKNIDTIVYRSIDYQGLCNILDGKSRN